jgi:hypothetical protein
MKLADREPADQAATPPPMATSVSEQASPSILRFTDAKWNASKAEWLDGLFEFGLPTCVGEWVGGSGGHRKHVYCGAAATYADWDCCYAYCDQHLNDGDRQLGSPAEAPWAALVRHG